ncbi:Anoctamin-7, partial [Borealophlyctis nickersoniae]
GLLHEFEGGSGDHRSIQSGFFAERQRGLLTYSLIAGTEVCVNAGAGERGVGIHDLLSQKIYTAFYHLHSPPQRTHLLTTWVHRYLSTQPIDDVRDYFGEKVALYFAFFGIVNVWLGVATVAGVVVCLRGVVAAVGGPDGFDWSLLFDNNLTPWLSLFISLWANLLVNFWIRHTRYLSWKWGTTHYEAQESRRPGFRPTQLRRSPVTGRLEAHFPERDRRVRQLGSAGMMLMWVGVVVLCIVGQILLGAFLAPRVENEVVVNLITSVVGLICINILKIPFGAVVERLNEWENYRTETSYEDALIIKRYILDFVNAYAQLFYSAFLKPHMGSLSAGLIDTCSTPQSCAHGVTIYLLVIFVGGQLLERFQEIGIPWIATRTTQFVHAQKRWWRRKREGGKGKVVPVVVAHHSADAVGNAEEGKSKSGRSSPAHSTDHTAGRHLPQYYHDDKLLPFQGVREEYCQRVLQLGYVTFFICAFPLAPLAAILNNVYELRADAFKMLTVYQRGVPFRAQDIGVWEDILRFIASATLITNASIVAFTSPSFDSLFLSGCSPDRRLAIQLAFVLAFHYAVSVVSHVLKVAVPETPEAVRVAMMRASYLDRVARDEGCEEEDEEL